MRPLRPRDRVVEHPRTIRVVPLPAGWRNWYRNPDGKLFSSDAPAVLLQEIATWVELWDDPDTGRVAHEVEHTYPEPRMTQAVVAALDGDYLEPASDAANYEFTTGPDEAPRLDAADVLAVAEELVREGHADA